ncbi:MAG: hypothetical protein J6N21_20450 [Butyrivibrio sp.]|nr:hypothetical protein [Butyrivibrio sp.]
MKDNNFKFGGTDNLNKGTFLIRVSSKENGTWQGNVLWADENRKEHFRSGLELLNMIDEALDSPASKKATG